ncbi:hypothetical protein E2562_015795 [Oryza meyeriana var. granulata]|uniref:Uncharacterized protein n=1 Tax=Oryza meyeriana var. granulata TaxID=110450 RepID=A0A6G1D571_9ORYZ|nr:hypothetical protein E2562_015795 [Oryza meyeriana var. granulata]
MTIDGKEDKEIERKECGSGNGNQGQREKLEGEIIEVATEILNVAVGKVLDEAFEKVMGEDEQSAMEEKGVESEAKVEGVGAHKKLEEWVTQAAMIEEAVTMPTRASARLARCGGRHSVEKAEKRKAWKNLNLQPEAFCYVNNIVDLGLDSNPLDLDDIVDHPHYNLKKTWVLQK